MLLTVEELVQVVRSSVNVQNSEIGDVVDASFLDMKDEDIKLYIKLASTKIFPEADTIEDLPEGSDFIVMLLTKIELYTKLAVLKANDVDLGADNNNYLKMSQRFAHYMKLIEMARKEYQDWLKDGGTNAISGVTSYESFRTRDHYSQRNYDKRQLPVVKVRLGTITTESVEVSWSVTKSDLFGRYRVYLSESPIIDLYRDGANATSKVAEDAQEIYNIVDIRDSKHRVEGLEPDTTYYIAVFSVERNGLYGCAEKSFTTLEPF